MEKTTNLYRKTNTLEIRPLAKDDQSLWAKEESLFKIIQEQKELRAKDREYHFAVFYKQQILANAAVKGICRENLKSAYLDFGFEKKEIGDLIFLELISAICDLSFTEIDLHRIEVLALSQQLQLKNVLKRASFREEGLRKFALYKDKKWQDASVYALTKEEYEEKNIRKLMQASHSLI